MGTVTDRMRDWNDMLSISSELFIGSSRRDIENMYRRGRSDEEFEAIMNRAKERCRRSKIDFAKDDLKRAIERCQEAGINLDEFIEMVKTSWG